jgi:hypothetical protein
MSNFTIPTLYKLKNYNINQLPIINDENQHFPVPQTGNFPQSKSLEFEHITLKINHLRKAKTQFGFLGMRKIQ